MMIAARYGIARGLFSNESGLGSAPIVAAAAKPVTLCARHWFHLPVPFGILSSSVPLQVSSSPQVS